LQNHLMHDMCLRKGIARCAVLKENVMSRTKRSTS
jgi:hypothetical protein